MLIMFLFYSFVLNDNLKHVLEMVYKNKELEAPNYNNMYYQTKTKMIDKIDLRASSSLSF
jgi:hypothetical protein